MSYPDRVETERLLLRRWEPRDRGAYLGIWGDPAVWKALRPSGPDPAYALERFDRHLRHWEDHGFGLWAAEEHGTGLVVGWIGAAHPTFVPELAHEVEIGWTLRAPFHGRGLAIEGARRAIECAFEHLAPERVVALVAEGNLPSAGVARRLGMRPGGRAYHAGARQQLTVYELSAAAAARRSGDGSASAAARGTPTG